MRKPTILTLSKNGKKFSATLDCKASIEDVVCALYGLCVAPGCYGNHETLLTMKVLSTVLLPDVEED